MILLRRSFFNQDPLVVARKLLGKLLCVKFEEVWLKAVITETECYYLEDKASHSSLGYTKERKAMFMPPGTIYMYYSRGGDSLNISCHGEGNAVLIKSAFPFLKERGARQKVMIMQSLNPWKYKQQPRALDKLCSGQALLCKSLNLKVNPDIA